MRLSFDPKPIGAFIEYTLKPLVDDSRELVEILEKHNLKLGDVIHHAVRIYVFDATIRSITSLLITAMICYTALSFLHTTR
jgi:hypothetical protein